MQIQKITLIASLFTFGCGEKSDEDKDDKGLDDLVEACQDLRVAYTTLEEQCGALDITLGDCQDLIDWTDAQGCVDEAKTAIECSESIGFESLYCNDVLSALETCQTESNAWIACVGF